MVCGLTYTGPSRAIPLVAVCILAACTPVEETAVQTAEPAEIPASTIEDITKIEQIDFTAYSMDLAEHVDLEIGEAKAVSNEKIQTYFKPEKGAEGSAEYVFTELRGEGGNLILAASNGLADDSVKAEELYAVFKDDTLIIYGLRQKCWRGPNSDTWQKTICP